MNTIKRPRNRSIAVLGVRRSPSDARADIVVFKNGRTMSVQVVQGRWRTRRPCVLRDGGEVTFPASMVARVDPDEVPYPECRVRRAGSQAAAGSRSRRQARRWCPMRVLAARPFADLISTVAASHNIDARLVHAVIEQESNYQARARSQKGAKGLMQLMPATARQYGVRNSYDPKANLDAGVRHLKDLMSRLELPLALAAYNAGEARSGDTAVCRRSPKRRATSATSFAASAASRLHDSGRRPTPSKGVGIRVPNPYNPLWVNLLGMEFRCRLGTTSGEIIEGVYVAQSEAALRRELEDKGLHVLSLKPRLGFGASVVGGPPQDQPPRVPGVQPGAGDVAEGRHAAGAVARHPAHAAHQPGVQVGARRRAREGAGRHGAVGRLRGAWRSVSVRLYRVADGRRARRQPRCRAAALRGVFEDGRHGPLEDHLRDDLSGHPDRRSRSCSSASSS